MSSLFDEMMEEICEKNQQISNLEAKLAESEERINWLVEAEFNRKWAKKYVEMRRKEDPMLCLPDSDEVYERYFELKQQLAEKDAEIEKWKSMAQRSCNLLDRFNQIGQIDTQDKISFCIEQLEKVKEKLIQNEDCYMISLGTIKNIINDQIKQLKERK